MTYTLLAFKVLSVLAVFAALAYVVWCIFVVLEHALDERIATSKFFKEIFDYSCENNYVVHAKALDDAHNKYEKEVARIGKRTLGRIKLKDVRNFLIGDIDE